MSKVFALVDCNNFFVSCERVFRPYLKNRPVVVLSNNDGCIIARSNEVKELGVAMCTPLFQARSVIDKNNIAVFSSNYALYADMSGRVMQTLSNFTDEMEIYSIDEAFLNLGGFDELDSYCREIKNTVYKWTGIPVSIGIANTKTLAKLANRLAKKSKKANGVLDLSNGKFVDHALKHSEAGDVWGVGKRIAARLRKVGIRDAYQLANADIDWVRNEFGVVVVRIVYELRGVCCYELEENPPAKKGITVSRSFGRVVTSKEDLSEAFSKYISRAAEKLRSQGLAANSMTLYAMTSRFNPDKKYFNSYVVDLQTATNDTIELMQKGLAEVERIFKKGAEFKKAGVMMTGLVDEKMVQKNLFDTRDRLKHRKLMSALDEINSRSDINVFLASNGVSQSWQTKFDHRSQSYTTSWDELLEVQ